MVSSKKITAIDKQCQDGDIFPKFGGIYTFVIHSDNNKVN